MSFIEIVRRARELLREEGRLSLRALRLEFDLDDVQLDAIIEELVDVHQVAAREGKILSWVGPAGVGPASEPVVLSPALEPETRVEAERRHLTVMFCDLVGSTDLSERLGAEDLRNVVRAYQDVASVVIERYQGYVAQYLGDGVLAYFGFPRAHEEDTERAVRSAREIIREIGALELEQGVRLSARVGIHCGAVVVSELGAGERRETLALGSTPNIAARLQTIAEPDSVVISDAALRLVAGLFEVKDLGARELKGIAEPIRIFTVIQPSGVRSRLDRATSLTPFIGREHELGLLLDRFERAQERQGQVVLISGEAGIGKSRLVHRLHEKLRDIPHAWLECESSPFARNSAFYPVIKLIEQGHHLDSAHSSEEKIDRLERGLAHVGLVPAETVPLLAPLLSLNLPERFAPLGISPQLQRQQTLEALRTWVLELGERQPVLLVIEDLHWADPTTLEWLGLLIDQIPTAAVLLVMTARPEFEPPWPIHAHLQPIVLARLRRKETRSLAEHAASQDTLPSPLLDEIARRSDGIPLFVEELARSVVESGNEFTAPISKLEIPETLQDSLMARLDRLADGKQVAQLGAALGREFPYELIEAVAPMKEPTLREGLGRLVEAELLHQRGRPPKATYTFRHALVQDTAYESLLESQRRELHGRIADAMEQGADERVAREPEQLALHCRKAGRVEQAVHYYQQAAGRATQRFARAEAIAHLHEAIELHVTLAESPERQQQELQLQIALGSSIFAAKGGWEPEAERAYQRARALCDGAEESPGLVRSLIGLSLFHFSRGEVRTSCEHGEKALALADRIGEVYPRLVAHTRLGWSRTFLGEVSSGHEHLVRAAELYEPSEHRPLASAWGQDWGTCAMSFSASVFLARGYPDQARVLMAETLRLAREGDPYSLSFSLSLAAILHFLLGERAQSLAAAEEALGIAREQGFPIIFMLAGAPHGWAVGGSRGIEELRTVTRQATAARSPAVGDYFHFLALACLEAGRADEALAAVQAGFDASGEVLLYDSRLHMTRGWALVQQGVFEEAAHSFRRAVEIARDQQVKTWELCAATNLARLLRDQGQREEARALLQPIYDWFTEGFDTQDMKDAESLLKELA